MKIEGKIERVNTKTINTKKGEAVMTTIEIAGQKYSGFNISGVKQGDMAEVHYKINGKYNNIKSISKIEAYVDTPKAKTPAKSTFVPASKTAMVDQSVWDDKDRRTVRMNSVRNAVAIYDNYKKYEFKQGNSKESLKSDIDTVLKIAGILEKWIYR